MNTPENTNEAPFPHIPDNLLKELNERFPELCALLEWDEKQVWFFAGQRAVIRMLNQIHKQQREDSLRTGD